MQPVVRAAIAAALFAGLGALVTAPEPRAVTIAHDPGLAPLAEMPCGPRAVPEGDACVPLPDPDEVELDPTTIEHERIPLRPDRPRDVGALEMPFDGGAAAERGKVDSSTLRVTVRRDARVVVPRLRGQVGEARLVALTGGELVATLHRVEEGEWVRAHLVIVRGSLAPAAELELGSEVKAGQHLATIESSEGAFTAVELSTRRLRTGVEVGEPPFDRLLLPQASVRIDARNVLREAAR